MNWQRWQFVVVGALLIGGGVAAFKSCGGHSAPQGAEAIPSAPPGLLCDLYVASPNASWTRLQRGIGGAVGILPATLPGVVGVLTDLDVQLADELDGAAPMFGAISGDLLDPGIVVAMKLVDPRRARGLLVDSETARYTATTDAGMTRLAPKRSGERRFELAITSNGYLLVSRRAGDLATAGPYVTRTLPSRSWPRDPAVIADVSRAAIQSALAPQLASLWKEGKTFLLAEDERMRGARGRAPDFGDPAAIVGVLDGIVGRRLDVVGDLDRIRIVLDVTQDAAVLTATLTPAKATASGAAKTWIDAMSLGDAADVLSLPASSALSLSIRDSEAARGEQSKSVETAIASALGQRLKDPAKLHDFLAEATKARSESLAIAVALEEPNGIFMRAPARDNAAANGAMRQVFDLTRSDPFKDLFRLREVTAVAEEPSKLGKIDLVTLVRESPPSRIRPRPHADDAGAGRAAGREGKLGVAWTVRDAALLLGAGRDPVAMLVAGAAPDRRLADEPSLKRFAAGLGKDATTVVVAQPLLLDPMRARLPTAPVGLAIGRKDSDAFVRIDVADGLLREATRWAMGF